MTKKIFLTFVSLSGLIAGVAYLNPTYAQSAGDIFAISSGIAGFSILLGIWALLALGGYLMLTVYICFRVYKDAEENNIGNSILWAILIFLLSIGMGFLGLIGGTVAYVYIIRKNEMEKKPTFSTGTPLEPTQSSTSPFNNGDSKGNAAESGPITKK